MFMRARMAAVIRRRRSHRVSPTSRCPAGPIRGNHPADRDPHSRAVLLRDRPGRRDRARRSGRFASNSEQSSCHRSVSFLSQGLVRHFGGGLGPETTGPINPPWVQVSKGSLRVASKPHGFGTGLHGGRRGYGMGTYGAGRAQGFRNEALGQRIDLDFDDALGWYRLTPPIKVRVEVPVNLNSLCRCAEVVRGDVEYSAAVA
jgi:hypothetical protein